MIITFEVFIHNLALDILFGFAIVIVELTWMGACTGSGEFFILKKIFSFYFRPTNYLFYYNIFFNQIVEL